jgi:hypothetical protein
LSFIWKEAPLHSTGSEHSTFFQQAIRCRKSVFVLIVFGCALTVAIPAGFAQSPNPNDPTLIQARAAFREGLRFAAEGKWADALVEYEKANKLRSHPNITYNLGYCERALGHYTRAERYFERALVEDSELNSPTFSPERKKVMQGYLNEIKDKIVQVTITFSNENVVLSVDSRPLTSVANTSSDIPVFTAGTAEVGTGTQIAGKQIALRLDPGRHTFVAKHEGFVDIQREIVVNAPSKQPIHFEFELKKKPIASVSRPPPVLTPVPTRQVPEQKRDVPPAPRPNYLPVYLSFGIGTAALITSGITGYIALTKKNSLDGICTTPKECPEGSQSDIQTMKTTAIIATYAGIVGAVGLGLGTYFTLRLGSSSTPTSTTARQGTSQVGIGLQSLYWKSTF